MIPRYSRPDMAAVWTDQAKYDRWLQVEVAAVQAWADEGVVSHEEAEAIAAKGAFKLADIDRYQAETHHEMTAFLRSVNDHVGEAGRWVHLGLTSSDVWDTATALQLRDAATLLERELERLLAVLEAYAQTHRRTLMVGRTHGVHAEPTTFGLKLLVWVAEVRRHQTRLAEAKRMVSVGKLSGAVGTHATVPPSVEEKVCTRLRLTPAAAANQIIQRDRHAQFVSTLALIAASLEKFATEIRHLQRTEVREVEEPFLPGQTGSSAMPHKRNPEKCERICGLARVLRGHATTAFENVSLWHERDISHSSTERLIFPDACGLLDYMLDLFTWVMENLVVFPERMRENLDSAGGLLYSQRVLLTLVEAGMQREEAYALVQRHAMQTWESNIPLLDLLLADQTVQQHLSEDALEECFNPTYYLRHVDDTFARLGL